MKRAVYGFGVFLLALLTAPLVGQDEQQPVALFVAGGPDRVGRWDAPRPWPVLGIHAAALPTGDILFYSYPDMGMDFMIPMVDEGSEAMLWNPRTGGFRDVSWRRDVFCSGHSFLPDGRLFVTGGWDPSRCLEGGIRDTYIFEPLSGRWIASEPMSAARYYPSNITLADGSVLILSGYDEDCHRVGVPELYEPGRDRIRKIAGAKSLDLYPEVHLLSSGKVAHVGPEPVTSVFDPEAGRWTTIGRTLLGVKRYFGTSFEIPGQPDRIMICGGFQMPHDTPTDTCEVIDFSEASPAWKPAPSMHYPRAHLNPVILPTGQVLIVGGGYWYDYAAPVHNPELYDPATNSWQLLPPQRFGRMYHSSALLVPDGRVISSGQDEHRLGVHIGHSQAGDYAEIYRPAYLFKGVRPRILEAPSEAGYGDSLRVKVTKAKKIRAAVLIAPSAVTHATNTTQRLIRLSFRHDRNKYLEITTPGPEQAVPPGYYMLFLLSDKGVPSEAAWIRLDPR